MDAHIRRLERQAKAGSYVERAAWKAALLRVGRDPDLEEVSARLTHNEEIQADYDEIWWHATKRLRFGWDMDPIGGLIKPHNMGHHSHRGENSKRRTLRTHRDGSRRNFQIKSTSDTMSDEELSPIAEECAHRRKKRFGGREHRGGWEWIGTWIYRIHHKVDLDE